MFTRASSAFGVLVASLIAMPAAAQAPFPGGRPLSGSIVCRVATSGAGFTETQTHTWTLIGAAPQVSNGDLWIHSAQWTVTGSGTRTQQSSTFYQSEEWRIAGGPLDAPIAIRSSGSNLTIELYHTPAQVSDGISGATTTFGGGFNTAPAPWREPAREAPLPPMQSPRLSASLTGSTSATITGRFPIHRQPAGADVVESCTWQIAPGSAQSGLPPAPPASSTPQQTGQIDVTGRRGANAPASAAPGAPASNGPAPATITVPVPGASPADGPWSGQAQCVLTARGPGYQDEQTHTWRITGGPPRMNGVFRQWPAVWSVTGRGARTGETWTINVPETSAPIAIWELAGGTGRLRIGSQHNGGLFEHKNDYPTDIYQFSTAAQFANEQEPFSSNSTRPQRIYPGRDRPIGLDDYSESVDLLVLNYSKIYWVDREYTFTREKIEALLTAPASGLAPGMFAVPFVDGDPHHAAGRLDGDYTLYFYVQRIP